MIGAGGTGGHVYPALAAAEALHRQCPSALELIFVGTVGGMERQLVETASVQFTAYHEITAGPLHGVALRQQLSSLAKIARGIGQSLRLLFKQRPQSLLLTGGWANVPLALGAWVVRVPIVIYLPDVEPGLTIRLLRHIARKIAVTVPESAAYFRRGQTVVTGYPLQTSRLTASKREGIAHFGLESNRQTLLVFGGSRGASSINSALLNILPQLLMDGLQIIHVSGEQDWPRVQAFIATLADKEGYHVFPYLHDAMGLAFAAADLVVCRAGASVLGELPIFGLPSILVPYPHAWRYQQVNADYLADRGAAIRMNDADLMTDLLPTIRALLGNTARLTQMAARAASLARPDGADQLAQLLLRVGGDPAW